MLLYQLPGRACVIPAHSYGGDLPAQECSQLLNGLWNSRETLVVHASVLE